ncbi:MAG: replicative DNA helicase [Candidatus Omnitrophota bacterium]
MDNLVPSDMGAEQSLLGCWLADPKGKFVITANVAPDEFYFDEHVEIANVITKMVSLNQNIDSVTVASQLKKEGKLDKIGGSSYLKKLTEMVPTTANASYYASTIIDLAHIRSMIRASRDAYELGLSPKPDSHEMETMLANALVHRDTGLEESSMQVCQQLLGNMSSAKHGQHVPRANLQGMDDLLHGFYPGTMYTIAARMSVGKSALLFWISLNAALQGFPVEVVSVEMKPELVAWRMVSAISGVNAIKYFTGELTDDEWLRVIKANEKLASLPIWFVRSKKTVDDVCLTIRRAKITHNIAIAGVDYLQMLHDHGHESRTAELDSISNKLKSLSEELDISLLSIVAANRRSVSEKGGVSIADMRGSDGIAYDTDVAIILNEDSDTVGLPEDVRRISLTVAKNRNGRQGENVIFFDKRYQRFLDEVPNG